MGQYRYPPALNSVRDENGDEAWTVIETFQDGEIETHEFSDREEALAKIEELRSADNPVEEDIPESPEPVEAVAEDPAVEGEPDGG